MALYNYEAGNYEGQLLSQGMSESRNGNVMLTATFQPLTYWDKARGEEEDVSGGDPITLFLVVTENSAEWVVPKLRKCGYTGNDFESWAPESDTHISCVGKKVPLRMKYGVDDKGKQRQNWDVNTYERAAPVDSTVREGLKGRYTSAFQKSPAPYRPPVATSVPDTDDEIPF